MSSFYRQQLEAWLKTLDVKAARVLDVGGSQLPVHGRTKSWEVESYTILDLPNPHQGQRPTLAHDLNEDQTLTKYRFDIVFCLEVMEYIYDPRIATINLAHWLAPGGTLYITFPFVYPQHEPLASDCLRYTLAGARRLLEGAGLTVAEVIPRHTEKAKLATFYGTEGMRAARAGANHEDVGYIIKATKPL